MTATKFNRFILTLAPILILQGCSQDRADEEAIAKSEATSTCVLTINGVTGNCEDSGNIATEVESDFTKFLDGRNIQLGYTSDTKSQIFTAVKSGFTLARTDTPVTNQLSNAVIGSQAYGECASTTLPDVLSDISQLMSGTQISSGIQAGTETTDIVSASLEPSEINIKTPNENFSVKLSESIATTDSVATDQNGNTTSTGTMEQNIQLIYHPGEECTISRSTVFSGDSYTHNEVVSCPIDRITSLISHKPNNAPASAGDTALRIRVYNYGSEAGNCAVGYFIRF